MNAVASRNIKFVGHSDMGGRGDGVQIMVHRGFAYVGHGFSNGITTIDVRDPKNPKVLDFIACPPGTRAFHLQTHEDLLLAVNAPSVWTMQEFQNEKAYFGGSPADKLKDQSRFTSGIRVYDTSDPGRVREIAYHVPEAPDGQPCIQLNDLLVSPDGTIFVTDRVRGGLYIYRRTS